MSRRRPHNRIVERLIAFLSCHYSADLIPAALFDDTSQDVMNMVQFRKEGAVCSPWRSHAPPCVSGGIIPGE